MKVTDTLLAPIDADEHREVGGVIVDVARAGNARVKRMIYPPGFNWGVHLKPAVGGDLCMHAHVGFVAAGQISIRFPDGCIVDYKAPSFVAIEPGHEGWVVGDAPAVLIEFDFEKATVERIGLLQTHRHNSPAAR